MKCSWPERPLEQGYEMIISFEGFIITIVSYFEPLARIIIISGLNTFLTAIWAGCKSKRGSVGTWPRGEIMAQWWVLALCGVVITLEIRDYCKLEPDNPPSPINSHVTSPKLFVWVKTTIIGHEEIIWLKCTIMSCLNHLFLAELWQSEKL